MNKIGLADSPQWQELPSRVGVRLFCRLVRFAPIRRGIALPPMEGVAHDRVKKGYPLASHVAAPGAPQPDRTSHEHFAA